jgi:A/G-specific adenine glycosylase
MQFAEKVVRWQRRHGRQSLPWQGTRDPYRIWLSEVMLQQTQVAAVIPYYERFLQRFPTVHALAAADQEEVLELWSGLGYYARGRNLHRAAREIAGRGFPQTAAAIADLPGVGRSTAAAIAAFAFGERAAILDGNAKRVLSRAFGIADEKALWLLAERLLPAKHIEAYTQGLMDLGAMLCTRRNPDCARCPLTALCAAKKQKRIHEFPIPRRRGVLPQKEVTWVLLRHQGAVRLERRPAPGIWGGLWCPPELNGKPPRGAKALPTIEHGFTHFRLRIHPLLCDVRKRSGGRWLKIDEAAQAALPAPVKTLLARLPARAS